MRLLLAALLVSPVLAGCLAPAEDVAGAGLLPEGGFVTDRGWSMPLSPALYEKLDPLELVVESFDGTPISVSIQFPAIAGCDWEAESLPESCRIPAVMDAGPYYGNSIDVEKFRPPLAEWLVPRGYAMVYMSVRGTGESGGCMELMSMNEQQDVDHVVTWLGESPWSNGRVGMMGRSYDGTTPLMAAALGNEYLKTIVPISGVTSVRDLMFKNGTSELRGPIFHNVVYWQTYGVGVGPFGAQPHRLQWAGEQACSEVAVGTAVPAYATLTGDAGDDYWEVRDFKARIVENYKGSVWIVHGLEDWNVNPSMVVPWFQDLQAAGLESRMWLGVWGHAYPDRVDEHRNVRWDWAEQTVQWFDHYLKGTGPKPPLDVEVEDSLFTWRREATYPPADAVFREVEVGALGGVSANFGRSFRTDPLEGDLRIAGLPQYHVEVTPTTAEGGYLFAELYDVFPDGRSVRIGWGAIDVAHHAGGNGDAGPLVPGQTVTALLEFEPMDAHVGSGHSLRLDVHRDGVEDILPSPDPSPLVVGVGKLRLPEVVRVDVLPSYVAPGLEG